MDAGVEIDETSPCWTFFNMAIAQKNNIGPSEPLSEEFALTQKSSWLLSGLASFLRPPGSVTGAKNFYDIATSTTTKLNQRFEQTRDLISNPPHAIGQEGSRDTPELMRAYGQDMRSYGLSLTVALIMNGVLSMHDPSSNHLICVRRHHSKEVLSLATEAAHLKPIGAGFVGVYLSAVWAVDTEARASVEALWETHGADFMARRSIAFSKKLRDTLQALH